MRLSEALKTQQLVVWKAAAVVKVKLLACSVSFFVKILVEKPAFFDASRADPSMGLRDFCLISLAVPVQDIGKRIKKRQ